MVNIIPSENAVEFGCFFTWFELVKLVALAALKRWMPHKITGQLNSLSHITNELVFKIAPIKQ